MRTSFKRINQYLQWQWWLAAIVVVLFACSQNVFAEKWDEWITPIFVFDEGVLSSIMLIIPLIYPVFGLCRKFGKGIFSPVPIFMAMAIISIYVYFRCKNQNALAYIYSDVAFADLYILIVFAFLIESIYNFLEANKVHNMRSFSILDDQPIEDEKHDELNRRVFVDQILDEILKMNSKAGAQTFGIVAPWGSGKTSFINLLKEDFKNNRKRDFDVIDFYPWHLPKNVSLTEHFFNLLSSRVRLFDRNLYSAIVNYVSWIIGEKNNGALSKFLSRQTSTIVSYQELCEDLSTCGKRFIVFIDDVDRLEGNEILEVFKLMRGSANFPNVTFVVAFDKEYVQQALSVVSSAMNENYIKKFFQSEYFLPIYSDELQQELAVKYASEFLDASALVEFKHYVAPQSGMYSQTSTSVISPFISNLRELKRWLNVV